MGDQFTELRRRLAEAKDRDEQDAVLDEWLKRREAIAAENLEVQFQAPAYLR